MGESGSRIQTDHRHRNAGSCVERGACVCSGHLPVGVSTLDGRPISLIVLVLTFKLLNVVATGCNWPCKVISSRCVLGLTGTELVALVVSSPCKAETTLPKR